MPSMSTTQASFGLAMLLKPFVLFAALALLLCVRYAIKLWMPDCWLKRLLLRPV